MITDLQHRFGSLIKALEVLAVMQGIKPAARILCPEQDYETYHSFFSEHDLASDKADFKVLKEANESSLYSDRSVKIAHDDKRQGHFFMYLAPDEATVIALKQAESEGDHKKLGTLLGYPHCCCEFFDKHFTEQQTDLTLDVINAASNDSYPFLTNIAGRHFDIALLSHFPCSFDCDKSIVMGQQQLSLINKHSEELGKLFEDFLKGVVIYTDMLGVFFLKDITTHENTISFQRVMTTADNKLYHFLESSKELEVVSTHKILIGDEEIGGEGFGIAYFV